MSELVRKMQEWRAVNLISSELIDEVKDLVREKAALEAKLEAMEQALFEVGEILATPVGLTPKTSVAISAIRIKQKMAARFATDQEEQK